MTKIMTVGAMFLALALFGCDSPEEPESARETEERIQEKTKPVAEEGAETEEQREEALKEAAKETEKAAEAAADKTEDMMAEAEGETEEAIEATEEKATEVSEETTEAAGKAAEEVEEAVSPETLVLEASFGDITFPHAMHSNAYDCTTCHGEGEPGLLGLEKDEAHSLCKGCHEEEGAGPTGCKDCHGS